ncbi:unnamed protein product [Urochloa humidicola]
MLYATSKMLKEKRYIDRLHLWQVFFANPYEWWDNRQSKPWASYPDFKHNDTREKIWLHPDNPPWVRKQLELHDLEVAENGHKGNGRLLKNHDWKAQDFNTLMVKYSILRKHEQEVQYCSPKMKKFTRPLVDFLFLCPIILLNCIDGMLNW